MQQLKLLSKHWRFSRENKNIPKENRL